MTTPIIGIDHGYAAMKTQNFSFPSGIVAYEHEPYTLKDVLHTKNEIIISTIKHQDGKIIPFS